MIQIFPDYIYVNDIGDIKERGFYSKSKLSTIEDYDSVLCFTDRYRIIKWLWNVKYITNITAYYAKYDVINYIFDLIKPSNDILNYDIAEINSDDILASWWYIYTQFSAKRLANPEIIKDLIALIERNITDKKILNPYNELKTWTKF